MDKNNNYINLNTYDKKICKLKKLVLSLVQQIDTFFKFESLAIAQKCFEVIYGSEIALKIKKNKIKHKINIYKYEN